MYLHYGIPNSEKTIVDFCLIFVTVHDQHQPVGAARDTAGTGNYTHGEGGDTVLGDTVHLHTGKEVAGLDRQPGYTGRDGQEPLVQ